MIQLKKSIILKIKSETDEKMVKYCYNYTQFQILQITYLFYKKGAYKVWKRLFYQENGIYMN